MSEFALVLFQWMLLVGGQVCVAAARWGQLCGKSGQPVLKCTILAKVPSHSSHSSLQKSVAGKWSGRQQTLPGSGHSTICVACEQPILCG